jgi:hypothetical protein
MRFTKPIFAILVLLSLVVIIVRGQESPPPPPAPDFVPSSWKEFISPDGTFRILMPGIPKDVSQPVETKAGSVTMTLHTLSTKTAEYSAGYTTFAQNIESLQSSKLTLDGLRDQLTAREKGKILDEQDVSAEEHPGRALVMEVADGIFRDRYYLVGHRIYVASVFMLKVKAASADDTQGISKSQEEVATRFLNSFRLVSK